MPRGDTATEEHTSQTHMHCAHVCPFATATAIQTFRSEINHFPYSKLLSKQRVQRSSTTSTTIHLRKFMRVQCQRYTESISLKILLVKFTNRANYVYLLNYGKFDTRYIYMSLHCLCSNWVSKQHNCRPQRRIPYETWTFRTCSQHVRCTKRKKSHSTATIVVVEKFPKQPKKCLWPMPCGRRRSANESLDLMTAGLIWFEMCVCVCVYVFARTSNISLV